MRHGRCPCWFLSESTTGNMLCVCSMATGEADERRLKHERSFEKILEKRRFCSACNAILHYSSACVLKCEFFSNEYTLSFRRLSTGLNPFEFSK